MIRASVEAAIASDETATAGTTGVLRPLGETGENPEPGEAGERARNEADRAEAGEAVGGERAVAGDDTAAALWSIEEGENVNDELVEGDTAITVAVTAVAGEAICGG